MIRPLSTSAALLLWATAATAETDHARTERMIEDTMAREFDALSSLAHLELFGLSSTQVSDPAALAGLGRLRHLQLIDTNVSDIDSDLSPLFEITTLTHLRIDKTDVHDLSLIDGLPELQALTLSGTPVDDLGTLAGREGLRVEGF